MTSPELPPIGSSILLVVAGVMLAGIVDGYSIRLGKPGRVLWLVENPGVGEITRIHVDSIEEWSYGP